MLNGEYTAPDCVYCTLFAYNYFLIYGSKL
jgi:hypothetical protein